MKFIKYISITLLLAVIPFFSQAQSQKKSIANSEFTVQGVCEMCKARIEEAALVHGVKMAEWDKSTGIIKVVYREDRITEQEIHDAIAAVGHATSKVPADSTAYSKLPVCCSYKDGALKH